MDQELKTMLRAEFPDHFICKAMKDGKDYFIGIPKKHDGKPIPSMPGLTVDMLHGATINLTSPQPSPASGEGVEFHPALSTKHGAPNL